MKLTGLDIHGFKSFADRTQLRFDTGITGVVGPNGCGKSNVIDAMRWVLGEQKTRNLRSEKMEDVLFNGASTRKRANMAEVRLSLENNRGVLPPEYSTVAITRRLYRDGESEYLLNEVPCRLKDIQNLLQDAGLGQTSYSIIELNMVKELLQDKNNARRLIFEDAAGISKYKARKKETLARLEETEQSLSRVDDLLYEIERNLRQLERQAKKAEQYNELRTTYKKASIRLSLLRVHHLYDQRRNLASLHTGLGDQLAQLTTQLAQHETRVQHLQKELLEQETTLRDRQHALGQLTAELQKRETDKRVRHERLSLLQQRQQTLTQSQTQQAQRQQELNSRLEQLQEQHGQAETQAAELTQQRESLEGQRTQRKEHLQNLRSQVDNHNAATRKLEEQMGLVKQQQNVLEAKIQGLQRELERGQAETSSRGEDLQGYENQVQQHTSELQRLNNELQRLQGEQKAHSQAVQQAETQLSQLQDQRYEVQRRLDAAQNEYELTKSLVESLDGFPESIRFLKNSQEWNARANLLSDLFNANDANKVLLEQYLEPYMNYYVVANRQEALRGAHLLQKAAKGRAQFFILDELAELVKGWPAPRDLRNHGLTPLLSLVEYNKTHQPLAQYLLQNVYLAQDERLNQLDSWNRFQQELGADPTAANSHLPFTVISRSGNLITRRLSLAGGSTGLFDGKRIGRLKNLEKLGKTLETLTAERDRLDADRSAQQTELAELRRRKPEKAVEACQRHINQEQQQLSAVKARAEQQANYLQRMDKRADDLRQDLEKLQAERAELGPRLEHLQAELNTAYQQQEAARTQLAEATEAQQAYEQRYNALRLEEVQAQNRHQALLTEQGNLRQQLAQLQENAESAARDLQQIAAELDQLANTQTSGDDELVELYQQQKARKAEQEAAEAQVQHTRNLIQQNEESQRKLRKQKDELQQKQAELKEQQNALDLKRAGVAERLSVEFNLELDQLDPTQYFEGPVAEQDLPPLEAEVSKLRERLNKFGDINPTAIEAYQEIKERHTFIAAQRDDLIKAKKDLLATIKELDETARKRFQETFEQIRTNFQQVFRSLFTAEDSCDLTLTRPDDLLESPIEIIARPKGKRPTSINQLSGGEMTLTAISLLFAIYLLKPAPFCVFDEVDAPLDDANIDKFNNIIRDFSSQSQFILVTHNKRTMVKTNVLYGVTMEETGVSRLLPVNLETLGLRT